LTAKSDKKAIAMKASNKNVTGGIMAHQSECCHVFVTHLLRACHTLEAMRGKLGKTALICISNYHAATAMHCKYTMTIQRCEGKTKNDIEICT
jgi:hypothetical protein